LIGKVELNLTIAIFYNANKTLRRWLKRINFLFIFRSRDPKDLGRAGVRGSRKRWEGKVRRKRCRKGKWEKNEGKGESGKVEGKGKGKVGR
jgi:hypothetical protein